MSGPYRFTRSSSRRGAAVAAVAALTASSVALLAPTQAVSAPDPACPPPARQASVDAGDAVHGLTVSHGTTPEAFTGEVIGTLQDGIAPGLDMIMMELHSAAIDGPGGVGGIWAGMSGSPVYAEDGRLIGAVAYGLAGTTPVAGITPARAMYRLLDEAPTSTAAAQTLATASQAGRVDVPSRLANRILADGNATRAQVSSGLELIPMPVRVSVLREERMGKLRKGLDLDGVRYYRAGSSAGSGAGDPTGIVAGGNLAATMSYGDLTSGGVGTATALCGGEVVGFGHPAMWSGRSSMTMHGADAVYVQKDLAWVPFKVANITGPVGRIADDRIAGIHGRLGRAPAGAHVRSHARMADGSRGRVGHTTVTVPDLVPDLGAFANLANLDRVFDGIAGGSSRVRVIVTGKRPDGRSFSLDRTDRFASPWDLTYESIWDLYDNLARMQYYSYGQPRITGVDVRTNLDEKVRVYRVQGAEVRRNGRWIEAKGNMLVRVRGGNGIHVRLHLASYRDLAGSKTVRVDMRMPRRLAGRTTTLSFTGGNSIFGGGASEPKTFQALLDKLDREVRNDALVTTLKRHRWASAAWKSKKQGVGQVVGGRFALRVRIVR
ncbi:MAG TPA: hypothetical protein VFJ14_15490 [Nocardioidaceae bacterium]|nr:hypothetical protein [Nocardioidaceae bacterium]